MLVTELPIVTLSRDEQPLNAQYLISVIVSGITTSVSKVPSIYN